MNGTTPKSSTASTADSGERADLLAALAAARSALRATVAGLSDEQAGERPTVSALCLGGLVKHVAAIEESWIRFVLNGPSAMRHDLPEGVTWADLAAGTARVLPQWAIDHRDGFRMFPGETLTAILERYARVAARSEEVVLSVPDLSVTHPLPQAPWNEPGAVRSVRRVVTHLIAETSHHAGHADILRESIDGHRTT